MRELPFEARRLAASAMIKPNHKTFNFKKFGALARRFSQWTVVDVEIDGEPADLDDLLDKVDSLEKEDPGAFERLDPMTKDGPKKQFSHFMGVTKKFDVFFAVRRCRLTSG